MAALQRKLPSLKKEARRDVVLGRTIDGDGEVDQRSALAVLRGPRLGLTAEECRKVGGRAFRLFIPPKNAIPL